MTEEKSDPSTGAEVVGNDADDASTPDVDAPAAEAATDDWAPPPSPLPPGYYNEDGVPRFDAVAERIQSRLAAEELREGSAEKASEDFSYDQLKQAGSSRLDEIRKQMGLDKKD